MNSNENAKYLSWEIQNEILEAAADCIRNDILTEVIMSKFYTILADETTDISNQSQFSLSLRSVHNEILKEQFRKYLNPIGLTGKELSETILEVLSEYGLDIRNFVGQGYDGCNNEWKIQWSSGNYQEKCPTSNLYSLRESYINSSPSALLLNFRYTKCNWYNSANK